MRKKGLCLVVAVAVFLSVCTGGYAFSIINEYQTLYEIDKHLAEGPDFKISEFTVNENRFTKAHIDEKLFDELLRLFSDESLITLNKEITEKIPSSELPGEGSFRFSDENYEQYYLFYFDSDKVLFSVDMPLEIIEELSFRWVKCYGWFDYRSPEIYDRIKEIAEELIPVKEAADKASFDAENPVNVYDFETVYSASFVSELMGEPAFEWGICTYRREGEAKDVTMAYWRLSPNEYVVSDKFDKSKNSVSLPARTGALREVVIDDDRIYEKDVSSTLIADFEIHLELTKELKASAVSFVIKYEGEVISEAVDVSGYKETGSLPAKYFSSSEKSAEEIFEIYRKEHIENVLKYINERSYISVGYTSREKYIKEKYYIDGEDFEAQKKAVSEFYSTLFDMIKSGSEECSHTEDELSAIGGTVSTKPRVNEAIEVSFVPGSSADYDFKIKIFDSHNVSSDKNLCFDVGNTEEISKYLVAAYDKELSPLFFDGSGSLYNVNTENEIVCVIEPEKNTVTIEGKTAELRHIERLEFDVKYDESWFGTPLDEISSKNETVHITIEHYYRDKIYFVLTMKGSKGTKRYFDEYPYSTLRPANNASVLNFQTDCVYEGNAFVKLKNVRGLKQDEITVDIAINRDTAPEIKLSYKPDALGNVLVPAPKVIYGNNFKYEFLEDYESLLSGKNLYSALYMRANEELLEIEKEIKAEAGYEELNPEKLVSYLKGINSEGKPFGYKITFIADIPLNMAKNYTSDWLIKLGDDIKATFVGFRQTTGNSSRLDYFSNEMDFTMLRFKGTDGEIWFNLGDSYFDKKDKEGNLIIENDYHSLTFFDGEKIVFNSINHETIKMQLIFSPEGKRELKALTVFMDSKTVNVGLNEINYIGGIATYDKMW